MSTVSQIGAAETAKYLMDIPSCVIPQDTDSFDSVYSDISTGDEDLDTIFEEVSKEYGVNVNLLKAVAQAESGFDSQAVSSAGAMGIMQLMPATAESLGVEDPYDARQNITGGAKMLGYLLADYNGDVTLALARIMREAVRYVSTAVFLRIPKRKIISARLMIFSAEHWTMILQR